MPHSIVPSDAAAPGTELPAGTSFLIVNPRREIVAPDHIACVEGLRVTVEMAKALNGNPSGTEPSLHSD